MQFLLAENTLWNVCTLQTNHDICNYNTNVKLTKHEYKTEDFQSMKITHVHDHKLPLIITDVN